MIYACSAHTTEMDDVAAAVADVIAQLNLPKNSRRHMAGVVACHPAFVQSGMVKALCDALPFDVVGATTAGQAVPAGRGILSLSLLVLASDVVRFATACTGPLQKIPDAQGIAGAYRQAEQALGEPPAMMMTFAPLLLQFSGNRYVNILNRLSGGVPNAGMLAMDETASLTESMTIFNGEGMEDRLVMLLLAGPVRASFFMGTVSESGILTPPAIISRSRGNLLQEVNGMPLALYLESLGLEQGSRIGGELEGLLLLLDAYEGLPAAERVLIRLSPEGYGVFAGEMPQGAMFRIAYHTAEDVISGAQALAEKVCAQAGDGVLLVCTCLSRSIALGTDAYAEFDAIDRALAGRMPYLAMLSGGEVCPVPLGDGSAVNRFHNNTIAMCHLGSK